MAVTSVVVVAMLVAGIIGAAYVFKSAVKDIEKVRVFKKVPSIQPICS